MEIKLKKSVLPAGLYIIGTPIGNLEDVTIRSLNTLHSLDILYAEDTRVSRVLLQRYGISVPLYSYRESAPRAQINRTIEEIIAHIQAGKSVGYVSDAGTPGVSDPGDYLVAQVRAAGCLALPIPGVSALATLLSVSGLSIQRPLFIGFLPRKKGKETMLRKLAAGLVEGTFDGIVLYESPERVVQLCKNLAAWNMPLRLVIGRELTKKFEQLIFGTLEEVATELNKNTVRGEVSVIIGLDA